MGLLNLDNRKEIDRSIFDCFQNEVRGALTNQAAQSKVVQLLRQFKEHLEAAERVSA